VYAATRRRVEELAARLAARGLRTVAYHAGVGRTARVVAERRFRDDEVDIVVATIAFGMGVDKPDIRWVFHADISNSLDEYYQELGRAGRDGEAADAVLYFRPEDLALPRRYASSTGPSQAALDAVAQTLSGRKKLSLAEIQKTTDLSRKRTEAALMALAETDAIAVGAEATSRSRATWRPRPATRSSWCEPAGRWNVPVSRPWWPTPSRPAAGGSSCWNFGEPAPARCGHCDNDDRADANHDDEQAPRPFPRGSRVRHLALGEGE
jgi:ATP-dependent DNA helicase RecQ